MDLWTELRNKARENRDRVCADPNSTPEERKTAEDILKLYIYDEYIRKMPRSTMFASFLYLGYTFEGEKFKVSKWNQMYYQLMEDIDRKYILIDPDTLPLHLREQFTRPDKKEKE